MRRLFLPHADLSADVVRIDGSDHHHLANVLRARVGESLTLLDDTGNAVHAEICAIGKQNLSARILGPADVAPEPPVHITVAQALGKGDRFEQAIQHATEAGASAFIPMRTDRAVVRLDGRDAGAKRARWSLVAKGAAEQAGRARIPSVSPLTTLADLSSRFADYALVLLLHPEGEPLVEALGVGRWALGVSAQRLLLLVGPEGGFAPEEVKQVEAAGARVVSLGPHVLRTETAALVAVSQILFGIWVLGPEHLNARGI
jgi:16S rRNA (uracil1498-N3)-methyltransferase